MFKLPKDRVFLVGEIGLNHNGDINIAKKLIKLAKENGLDAVKFQKRTIELVYSKKELDTPRESPWGKTNREQKQGLELTLQQYNEINAYCKEVGIYWTASPWDTVSVDFLNHFNPPFIKVASASITDKNLLEHIARTSKPIFLSTGMSDIETIQKAVDVVLTAGGNIECLYHCTSTYPTDLEEVNLLGIKTLQKVFPNLNIGYSGHEMPVVTSAAAVALGARSVERHITLSRAMYGSDQAASLDPEGVRRWAKDTRTVEKALGDGKIKLYESEVPIAKKLRKVRTLW